MSRRRSSMRSSDGTAYSRRWRPCQLTTRSRPPGDKAFWVVVTFAKYRRFFEPIWLGHDGPKALIWTCEQRAPRPIDKQLPQLKTQVFAHQDGCARRIAFFARAAVRQSLKRPVAPDPDVRARR